MEIKKPCTLYISIEGAVPNVFKMFSAKYGLYYFRHLEGKVNRIKFNVCHPGQYSFNCRVNVIKSVPIEIPENLPEIPSFDRQDLRDFKIVNNPNLTGSPARIYRKEGIIEKGRDFKTYPAPVRTFILLHEVGHFFYGLTDADIEKANRMSREEGEKYLNEKRLVGEMKCDQFALVHFLNMGYNRSTAFYALSYVLSRSKDNINRLKSLFNNIQKTQDTVL